MEEIIAEINKLVRAEHGDRITIDNMWTDTHVDSFGTTVIFLDLDEKYGCFGKEWFESMTKESWEALAIKDIVEKIQNASTQL